MDPSAPEVDVLAGSILDGKYLILGELGAGGMGVVYEGRNLAIGRRVAIKMLHRCQANHAEAVERFEREARASAPIAHRSIVDVLDMGRTEAGLPYIVMEHLEGVGLYERLLDKGPLSPSNAVDVVMQVLDALSAAHAAGVVHRDVKPENVFLVRGESGELVKILDFGAAKFTPPRSSSGGRITRAGRVVGTPGYMSPEQAQGSDVDERSDLYSAGVLLYELLSGKLPDGPEGLSSTVPILQVAPWLPEDLAVVIGKALDRAPEDRFQTAASLMEALRPFQQAPAGAVTETASARARSSPLETTAGLPVMPAGPAPTRRMPRPLYRWLGLGLAAAVSIGVTLAVFRGGSSAREPAIARPESGTRQRTPSVPRATVRLAVASNVQGARVLLDGRPVGITPFDTEVPPRTYTIRVEAAGHESLERKVLLSAATRVDLVLDPVVAVPTELPITGRVRPTLPYVHVY